MTGNIAGHASATYRAAPKLNVGQEKPLLDLFLEDSRLNVYAGELEVRPPGAPTTLADGAVLARSTLGDLSADKVHGLGAAPAGGAWTCALYLTLAHRGVIHVRGKDCVHPDISLVIVRMISFPARESGQRARMAVR